MLGGHHSKLREWAVIDDMDYGLWGVFVSIFFFGVVLFAVVYAGLLGY